MMLRLCRKDGLECAFYAFAELYDTLWGQVFLTRQVSCHGYDGLLPRGKRKRRDVRVIFSTSLMNAGSTILKYGASTTIWHAGLC